MDSHNGGRGSSDEHSVSYSNEPYSIRNALAAYARGQSEWRAWKASDYPEDGRNAQAADGLQELAGYIESLPADDPRPLSLALQPCPSDIYSPWEEGRRLMSRFRFNEPTEDCDTFLTRFVEAEQRGYAEAIQEGVFDETEGGE